MQLIYMNANTQQIFRVPMLPHQFPTSSQKNIQADSRNYTVSFSQSGITERHTLWITVTVIVIVLYGINYRRIKLHGKMVHGWLTNEYGQNDDT